MDRFVTRVVFVGLVLVVAFAVVFTLVDASPAGWPTLPPHFGRDLDLACGLAFCATVTTAAIVSLRPGKKEVG